MAILRQCCDDEVFRDYIILRCSQDSLFFINVFCFTHDPRRNPAKLPFITYPYQDDLIRALDAAVVDGEDLRVEKSRDMGVSWCVCLWMTWRWLFHPHQSFLMLSRKEDLVDGDSDSLFGHIDFAMKSLPAWLIPPHQRTKLKLINGQNGSAIEGESTNGDAGRGGRRTAILWDEAAAFPNGGYEVASATRDNTRCRIMNSTPKGEANYFAESRKTTKTFTAHWSLHPRKNPGMYRVGKRGEIQVLDESYGPYKQVNEKPGGAYGLRSPWYDNECKRTPNPVEIAQELDIDYLGSDYPFFSMGEIDRLLERAYPALMRGEIKLKGEAWEFTESDRGPLSLWVNIGVGPRWLPPRHREFVVACDVGSGTGASDSVASVADRQTGEKVAEWVSNQTSINEFARATVALCKMFSMNDRPALLVWEANGPGLSFAKMVLSELKFRHVWYKKDEFKVASGTQEAKPGWNSTAESKPDLLAQYREALSMGRFINPSAQSLLECKQFKCTSDGRVEHQKLAMMQDGAKNHGDRVIADALANMLCLNNVVRNESREPRPMGRYAVGSIGWLMQKEASEERETYKARY
jgi:hypothetical protein